MNLATAAHWLPTVNAALNSLATLLLAAGWIFIRRGKWRAHRAAMIAAFAVSTLFLVCYLTYHALVGHVPFTGQGTVRLVYLAILLTHIVLAVTVPYRPLEVRWSASALSENHHMLPRQRAGGALPHQGVGSGFLADLGFAHFVGGFDGHTRVFQPVFHIRDAATGL